MTSKAAASAAVSDLDLDLDRARGREQAAYRAIRVLAVAVVAFVVTTSFQARPIPGGHGEALGAAAALIVFSAATLAMMWPGQGRPARS